MYPRFFSCKFGTQKSLMWHIKNTYPNNSIQLNGIHVISYVMCMLYCMTKKWDKGITIYMYENSLNPIPRHGALRPSVK
jgi:hypothetical protein